MAVRSELYHRLGGLDEKFFAHMEEIDFCWRAYLSGSSVWFCHESSVYHVGGATLNKSNPRKTYLNFRNGLQMLLKNLYWREMLWVLPSRILLDWVAMTKFLVNLKFGHGFAVIKAHLYILINGLFILFRRTKPAPNMEIPMYRNSIVFDYFLRGKKKYSELTN